MLAPAQKKTLRRSESLCSGLSNRRVTVAEEADRVFNRLDDLWTIHKQIRELRGHMLKQKVFDESLEGLDEDTGDGGDAVLPQSYIVIRISKGIQPGALEWLVNKIRGKRRDGGAELIVLKEPRHPSEGIVLHISASKIKFLEVAEELEMRKQDRSGQVREFVVSELEDFMQEGMHVEDLLTVAERQTIIRHELENIRALEEDHHVPGYLHCTLYEGQSIIHVCLRCNIVEKMYPLHDNETLKKLGGSWYLSVFRKQPIEEIRQYFGEAVALYFAFLGFYTTALLVPTFLGFLQLLLSKEAVPFFCIVNVVWVTVFLEVWRRRSNALAFQWGTIGMTSLDEPRPNFYGPMGIDPITGKMVPQYPRLRTYFKMYCVSFPIVILCMLGGFIVMLTSFWAEDYMRYSQFSPQMVMLPSVVYSIAVYVVNLYYRKLATYLTDWENHRTQSQFDRHRVTKLVLFEFVNNFMSLFYIAFVLQDMDMLRMQLATMLIILQAINNIQEAILPLIIKFYLSKAEVLKKSLALAPFKAKPQPKVFPERYPKADALDEIREIHPDDERLQAAFKESQMENYEETYDDYLEMFIQFGYVVLFSSVYPVAAFWALVNNVLEIRADAFKLCCVNQRPMSKKVKDIGAWQRAFEILGALSILTNCALLCLDQMKKTGTTLDYSWILTFALLEHFLLGIRYLLHIAIPDKPEWVRVALARRNYEYKKALKNEKMQKNRRILTRKFKTVHGQHAQPL